MQINSKTHQIKLTKNSLISAEDPKYLHIVGYKSIKERCPNCGAPW